MTPDHTATGRAMAEDDQILGRPMHQLGAREISHLGRLRALPQIVPQEDLDKARTAAAASQLTHAERVCRLSATHYNGLQQGQVLKRSRRRGPMPEGGFVLLCALFVVVMLAAAGVAWIAGGDDSLPVHPAQADQSR